MSPFLSESSEGEVVWSRCVLIPAGLTDTGDEIWLTPLRAIVARYSMGPLSKALNTFSKKTTHVLKV